MARAVRSVFVLTLVLLGLAGCVAVSNQPGFEQVQVDLADRGIEQVHWYTRTEADAEVRAAVHELLDEPLTVDAAVQIALLNNHRLQASYQQLGVAQADLVQAGLLRNPIFDAAVRFPLSGGATGIDLAVTQSFLEILFIPMQRSIAESELEAAKLTVTGQVLDLVYQTQLAFYHAQADVQRLALYEQAVLANELTYDFARRLREAGNITELELHQQRDVYEQAKLSLRRAEARHVESRERVNRLLGLWGEQAAWEVASRLPDLPENDDLDLAQIESHAVEASVDLAVARQRILTAGRRLGITDATALLPGLELGAEAERNGDWAVGPTLSLPIPLFDQGQARIARNRSELHEQQHRFTALATEIRSIARDARNRFEAAEDIARYHQAVILPLRERITNETQLQYHAMQVGPVDLLNARERQIEAEMNHTDALYDYWSARATIEQLQRGRTPQSFEADTPSR